MIAQQTTPGVPSAVTCAMTLGYGAIDRLCPARETKMSCTSVRGQRQTDRGLLKCGPLRRVCTRSRSRRTEFPLCRTSVRPYGP